MFGKICKAPKILILKAIPHLELREALDSLALRCVDLDNIESDLLEMELSANIEESQGSHCMHRP